MPSDSVNPGSEINENIDFSFAWCEGTKYCQSKCIGSHAQSIG